MLIYKETTLLLSIDIPCNEIKTDIVKTTFNYLRAKYEGKAFQQFGLIKSIIGIDTIVFQDIKNINGTIGLALECRVLSYLPKQNDILKLPVKRLLSRGAYLETTSFKLLISEPIQSSVAINDEIEVELTDIRFENNLFLCLGKLTENSRRLSDESHAKLHEKVHEELHDQFS